MTQVEVDEKVTMEEEKKKKGVLPFPRATKENV